jgi:hypothetical protein
MKWEHYLTTLLLHSNLHLNSNHALILHEIFKETTNPEVDSRNFYLSHFNYLLLTIKR